MATEHEQVSDVRTYLLDNISLDPQTSYQGPADDVRNYRFWGVTATATQTANKIKVILEYRFYSVGQWREFDSFYISDVDEAASIDRVYRVTRGEYRARLDNEDEVSQPFVDLQYIKGGN
ncbi:MAG: hypothetical protein GF375_00835 [Candidatus Omnitrophica bacterium]|nr:hypothetical protein [Candidatus Omnitrophota bacterium]